MKKILGLFLTAVMALGAFLLWGCADKNALRVINFRPEDEDFYEWMVEQFEAETGIKVIYESISTEGYPNLLNSRLTADKVDVWGTEAANVRSLPLRKDMLALDDLTDGEGKSLWEDFSDGELEQATHKGSIYVAPMASVNVLVYYNRAVFELLPESVTFDNGEYPTTWMEFYRLLAALKGMKNQKKIDDVITFGGMEAWPISMITTACEIPAVRAEDEDFYLKLVKEEAGYDFGHAYYRNFFTRLREICGFIDPLSTGQTYSLAPATFANTKSALMIDGSWSYQQVVAANPDIELGFFPLPLSDDAAKNKFVATKSGSAFAINKDTDKVDASKKFIQFHYRPDVYEKYINFTKNKPVIKGVELKNKRAQQMYAFDSVVAMENMWMDGIQGVGMFRDIGLKYISGSKTVQQSVSEMNEMLGKSKSTWKKKSEIGLWLERYYPQEVASYPFAPES